MRSSVQYGKFYPYLNRKALIVGTIPAAEICQKNE